MKKVTSLFVVAFAVCAIMLCREYDMILYYTTQMKNTKKTLLDTKLQHDVGFPFVRKEIDNEQKLKKIELQEYCPHNITKLQNFHDKWNAYRLLDAVKGYYFRSMTHETPLKNFEKFGNKVF